MAAAKQFGKFPTVGDLSIDASALSLLAALALGLGATLTTLYLISRSGRAARFTGRRALVCTTVPMFAQCSQLRERTAWRIRL